MRRIASGAALLALLLVGVGAVEAQEEVAPASSHRQAVVRGVAADHASRCRDTIAVQAHR